MFMALFFLLMPSRTPWWRRYANYVTNRKPNRRAILLSLFERDKVFSYRYDILRTRWFNIGLHNIVSNDEPMLHTHDWSFMSRILEGGYVEHVAGGGAHFRAPGSWLFRPFTFQHYIQLLWASGFEDIKHPAWTLLITSAKRNVHQFEVPRYGLIRWDLLIFKQLIDNERMFLTVDEQRFLTDTHTRVPFYV